jgi:uncharacterized membrane protein YciS (DUF1049 family)
MSALQGLSHTAGRASEEVMSITQDSARNRIITLNLFASSGAFAMSTGTMVTGLFGICVHIHVCVCFVCLCVCVCVCVCVCAVSS